MREAIPVGMEVAPRPRHGQAPANTPEKPIYLLITELSPGYMMFLVKNRGVFPNLEVIKASTLVLDLGIGGSET